MDELDKPELLLETEKKYVSIQRIKFSDNSRKFVRQKNAVGNFRSQKNLENRGFRISQARITKIVLYLLSYLMSLKSKFLEIERTTDF